MNTVIAVSWQLTIILGNLIMVRGQIGCAY